MTEYLEEGESEDSPTVEYAEMYDGRVAVLVPYTSKQQAIALRRVAESREFFIKEQCGIGVFTTATPQYYVTWLRSFLDLIDKHGAADTFEQVAAIAQLGFESRLLLGESGDFPIDLESE
jgi:hypothetical protein